MAISGQEFYAAYIAAAPNDFAWLALWMIWHKRQFEPVADIERGIDHHPGAARRDIQYEAFELRDPVVDPDHGRLLARLPSRLALYLCPWLGKTHDDYPLLELGCDRRGDRQSTSSS
jgi:hypothetical protein